MLEIVVPGIELFNEEDSSFTYTKDTTLKLEHSLVSISKWESKYKKPFISKDAKTDEEILFYIKCMTITQNVDPIVFKSLTEENLKAINDYIDDSQTATWFSETEKKKQVQREVITSEIIYYWMIALNIPTEFQKWHINRLLTLINVCNIKNQPPKNLSRAEALAKHRSLNASRRKQFGRRG